MRIKFGLIITLMILLLTVSVVPNGVNADEMESCGDVDVSSDNVIVQDDDIYREYMEESDGEELEKKKCIVEEGVGDFNVLKSAIGEADYNETVIIKQRSGDEGYREPYYGTEINKDVFGNGKNLTIKGEENGFVSVQSMNGGNYAFKVKDNEHERIKIENLHITGEPSPIFLGSKSYVVLEDVSLDSSATNQPIRLQKTLGGDTSKNGVRLELNGVYYSNYDGPNQDNPRIGDVTKVLGGSDIRVIEGEIVDRASLSVVRNKQPMSTNPVSSGKISNVITVRGGSDAVSDSDLTNDFKTLDAALQAAGPDAIIELKPHSDDGYESVNIVGNSLTSAYDLTIRSADGSGTVDVSSFNIRYPGSYQLSNLNIKGDISVTSNNVEVDATDNYWNSASGPNLETDINIGRDLTSSVTTQPFCESESCAIADGYVNYPYCLQIFGESISPENQKSINCGGDTDTSLEIVVDEFEHPYDDGDDVITDQRMLDFTVESSSASRFDVNANIIESDQSNNLDTQILPEDDSVSVETEPTFGIISQSMETSRISVKPRVEFTINGNDPILVKLDESDLEIRNPDLSDISGLSEVVESPPDQRYEDTFIEETEYDGVIPDQDRFVTQFNAGSSDSNFQSNSIPPFSDVGGDVVSSSVGTVKSFENAKTNENGRQAILLPDTGTNNMNIGFKHGNIPSAEEHILEINYAYQAADIDKNNIVLNITDSSGDKITNRDSEIVFESTDESGSPFDTVAGASGEDIGSATISEPLSKNEIQYINKNGEIYYTISNDEFETGSESLHIYSAKIVSTDNFDIEDEGPVTVDETEPEVYPGDISVALSLNSDISEYDTYDYEPGEEAVIDVEIQNTGDTATDVSYVLTDEYGGPDQGIPGETDADDLIDGSSSDKIKEIEETIPSRDSITVTKSVSWKESEFGTHDIKLWKKLGDGSKEKLDPDRDRTPSAEAYVKQPATVGIDDVGIPDEHVSYDPFTAEVTVKNVGDLSGEVTVQSEFASWSFSENVELSSSDARSEDDSTSTVKIIYSRNHFPDADDGLLRFTRREYTTALDVVDDIHTKNGPFETSSIEYSGRPEKDDSADDYYRPNAPFSTTTGTKEFRVTVNQNELEGSNPVVDDIDNALQYTNKTDVRIYNLKIDGFRVNVDNDASSVRLSRTPNEDNGHVYASAWPYAYPSYNNGGDLKDGVRGTVRDGESILYGAENESVEPKNRASIPLNNESVPRATRPNDRYFGIYYTHQNRVCNENQLSDLDNRVHKSQRAVEKPSDVINNFLAFSADSSIDNSCTDVQRITRVHPMRFVGSTSDNDEDVTIDTTDVNDESSIDRVVSQPNNDKIFNGTNKEIYSDIEEDDDIMYGYVKLSNDGSAGPVTARIEIITDQELGDEERDIDEFSTETDNRVVGLKKPEGSSTSGKIDDDENEMDGSDEYSEEGTEVHFGSSSYDANVVGAAAVRLKESETITVPVPIVIRNNENVEGVHELTVRSRQRADVLADRGLGNKDYTEQTDDIVSDISESPITTEVHDQWTVPIKVETYGDMILTSLVPSESQEPSDSKAPSSTNAKNADLVVNEVCRSNEEDGVTTSDNTISVTDSESGDGTFTADMTEGLNPKSGTSSYGFESSDGDCLDDDEAGISKTRASFDIKHTNVGGEAVSIRPEILGEFQAEEHYTVAHRKNAHTTGDRYFAPYSPDNEHHSTATDNTEVKTFFNQINRYSDGDEEVPNDEFKKTVPTGVNSVSNITRRFQEPGYYKIRGAPCRKVGDKDRSTESVENSGPKHYDYQGFTGVPDRNSYTKGDYIVSKTNIDRVEEDDTNKYTTNEIKNSVYHGTRGCAEHVSSVFVYDITEPVADFRVAHSRTQSKAENTGNNQYDEAKTTDRNNNIDDNTNTLDGGVDEDANTVSVHEGGVLFFDGSTPSNSECPQCYSRPHFDPYDMDIPSMRDELKRSLDSNVTHTHRMSSDNARIIGKGTGVDQVNEFSSGYTDAEEITSKGMRWTIGGEVPNYAQDSYCTEVDPDDPDQNCYMERFQGAGGVSKPDYYEVVPHRFDETGEKTVKLKVWDDPSLTRGGANTNITEITVNVEDDEEAPNADVTTETYNNLTYDKEDGDSVSQWARIDDEVFSDSYADYVDSTPDNFDEDSNYGNTYEGARTCLQSSITGDPQTGISQDLWFEQDHGRGNSINADNTLVIENGDDYADDEYHNEVVRDDNNRDGDEKCIIQDDTTENTYVYSVWDHAYNEETIETDIEYKEDEDKPSMTIDAKYDTATGSDGDSEDNGWVWAWNYDAGFDDGYGTVDYDGDDVKFNIDATDDSDGVGIACIDLQLDVDDLSGGTNNDADINDNCQSMGDGGGSDTIPTGKQGTHGNDFAGDDGNDGASADIGSSSSPGKHSSTNYFTASELGDDYELNSEGSSNSFSVNEDVYATDWHGNTKSSDIEITVKEDGTKPTLEGSFDGCPVDDSNTNSCGSDTVQFRSSGPGSGDGGTPIVDAKVSDYSNDSASCSTNGQGDGNSDCSFSFDGSNTEVEDVDQNSFDGDVKVSVDASVDPDASVEDADADCDCGEEDEDDNDVYTTATLKGDVTVKIMDAHGNTREKTYDWKVEAEDHEGDYDDCDRTDENCSASGDVGFGQDVLLKSGG